VELSVRIPSLAQQAAPAPAPQPIAQPQGTAEADDDYGDRKGYLPDFLPGFHVPLPQLGPGLKTDAAPLLEPEPGANPFELKYNHFSVVMNKRRRLAFFTACMIDGKTAKSIGRSSRKVSDLKATDSGLREAIESLDDAEADSWSTDPRIDREHYSGDEVYKGQKVPGHPDPRSKSRIARMFQKGHLVRRLDPAWGDETRALEAELDTFHWTNAAPQVGFFNQGTADEDQPGTGRGNLWRAAENYVLRNAVAEDQRVISFTGPVFRDDDREFRHLRIPGKSTASTAKYSTPSRWRI
jgi:endonuclease G